MYRLGLLVSSLLLFKIYIDIKYSSIERMGNKRGYFTEEQIEDYVAKYPPTKQEENIG